jgi:hypothetical protein
MKNYVPFLHILSAVLFVLLPPNAMAFIDRGSDDIDA